MQSRHTSPWGAILLSLIAVSSLTAQRTKPVPSPKPTDTNTLPGWFTRGLAAAKRTGFAIAIIIPDAKPIREDESVEELSTFKGTKLTQHPKLKLTIQKLDTQPRPRLVRRRMVAIGKSRLITIKGYKYYDRQDEVSFALELLHHIWDVDLQCALMAVPMVCARAEWVGAKPRENLVLVDATGKRVAGQGVDLCFPKDVRRGIQGLLQRDGRWDRLAKSQATDRFRQLLAGLRSDDRNTLRKSQQALIEGVLDHAIALDAAQRMSQSAEERRCIRLVIQAAFARQHQFPAGAVIGNKPGPLETVGRHIGRARRIMLRFRTDR